jgi:hypothetical protein
MPAAMRVPTVALVALLVLALLLYAGMMGSVTSLHASDAAGNGLAEVYAVFLAIALWLALAVILVIAGINGEMPGWAAGSALVLHPVSCAAAIAAISLLSENASAEWPVVVPAFAPLLIALHSIWAYFAGLRAKVPASLASTAAWGAITVLAIAPWPVIAERSRLHGARVGEAPYIDRAQQEEESRRNQLASFQQLTPDSPLLDYLAYTQSADELRVQALEGARQVRRRQSDAEALLKEGYGFWLSNLPRLDLAPTPSLCAAANGYLVSQAERNRPRDPPDYWLVEDYLEPKLPAIEWLVQQHCDVGDAVAAIEATVAAYPESARRDRFLSALAQLHPPH